MASLVAMIRSVWNEWELRSLVLISLLIQILLICFASVRKRRASKTINFFVWSCYLLADWVATLALAVLAKTLLMMNNNNNNNSSSDGVDVLKAFWAPFLLLHLGGPDNITAFSLEDNELWLRHLVGLLFQVGTAIYIFITSLPVIPSLSWKRITILMLIGGIIKYVERTWALMNASRDHFRKPTEIGWFQVFFNREQLESRLLLLQEIDEDSKERSDLIIWNAYVLFQVFKVLIFDNAILRRYRDESRSFFMNTSWEKAYKLIEIELGFLYETLYTKAAVVRTWKGWILRFTTISFIIAVSVIFFGYTELQSFDKINVAITCVLLSGAIALEFWSLGRLLFTDRTVAWMMKKKDFFNPSITRCVAKVVFYNRTPKPNYMAQYNLTNYCLKDHRQLSLFWAILMKCGIDVKQHHYKFNKEISEELKIYIFQELQEVSIPTATLTLATSRGQLALEIIYGMINNEKYQILEDNIKKVEFDESILVWRIATDMCYHLDREKYPHLKTDTVVSNYQRNSRDISNYLLFLLVSRPSMLTAAGGFGDTRFQQTCIDIDLFLHLGEKTSYDEKEACECLLRSNLDRVHLTVFSALRKASKVAEALMSEQQLTEADVRKRRKMISRVWLEMLCYAASECRGYYHAQRLGADGSGGGEFLTIIWFLLVHFNLGMRNATVVWE